MKRWLAFTLLTLLMGLVVAVNAEHFGRNPFPPRSMHRAFMMVPRLVRNFQGYQPRPRVVDHMDPSGKSYALPVRRPIQWTHPRELLEEFRPGGRLYRLVGDCSTSFYTCMPHSFSFLALLGTMFPGHPILVNLGITLYFLLLLFSIYGIGYELADRTTGLAAAAIAASYPGLFGYSRWIEGYLPATALSVAMIYCLLRSRGLTRWLPCLAFTFFAFSAIRNGEGLSESIGAGMAVSGPFLLTFGGGLISSIKARRFPIRTLAGALFILGVLALTMDYRWLFDSFTHIFTGFNEWGVAARPGDPNASRMTRLAIMYGAYFILIYTQYLKPLMTIWLLIALPFFLVRRHRGKAMIILWFFIPAVAYATMARKALWYALPIIPPLALVTALGLAALRQRQLRKGVLTLAGLTGLVQFLAFSVPAVVSLIHLPAWFNTPLPPNFMELRQSELVAPVKPELMTLKDRTERFLQFLEDAVPRSDRLKHIAVVSNWGEDIYLGQVFSYVVNLSRPDLEAIPLAEPAFVEMEPYSGLRPEYFAFYVRIIGGDFAPCCDKYGRALLTNSSQGHGVPPPLERFANLLLRQSLGRVPGLPNIRILAHPEVRHLVGTTPL